jgi:parallel beta-helix repeat protein
MGESRDGNYIGMYNIGSNSLIQYNRVINTGYNGIDFRGANIQVLNNVVDTFCNVKDDGAGIYTFTGASTTVYALRTVDHNIVSNAGGASNGTNTTNEDAHGIYMDDNSSQVLISNNTVYNCGAAGIFLHAAHAITLQNNTLYNNALRTANTYAQIYEAFPGATGGAAVRDLVVTGNKFVSKEADQIVAFYKTNETNMSQWPLGLTNTNFNNNYYARPINEDATTFQIIRASGTTNTDLPGWTAASGGNLDSASNISPVTILDTADLRFEVNETNGTVTVSLGGDYIDVTGAGYAGSIDLPAYSSAVLILVGSGDLPPEETVSSITINFTPCDPAPVEGYNILYREVGTVDYIDAGFFTSSPAVISVSSGAHFEGVIKSECGDVPWNTA